MTSFNSSADFRGYAKSDFLPNERVLYRATLHWIVYVQALAFTATGGLLALFGPTLLALLFHTAVDPFLIRVVDFLALALVVVGIVLLVGAYARQNSTALILTNKRLIMSYGFFSHNIHEILIGRIVGADFHQTPTESFFGFGTVQVNAPGNDKTTVRLVANPALFYRALIATIDRAGKPLPAVAEEKPRVTGGAVEETQWDAR